MGAVSHPDPGRCGGVVPLNKTLKTALPDNFQDWVYTRIWGGMVNGQYYAHNFKQSEDSAFFLQKIYIGFSVIFAQAPPAPGAGLIQCQIFGQISQNARQDFGFQVAPDNIFQPLFLTYEWDWFFPAGMGWCFGVRGFNVPLNACYYSITVKGRWFTDKNKDLGRGEDFRFAAGPGVTIINSNIP